MLTTARKKTKKKNKADIVRLYTWPEHSTNLEDYGVKIMEKIDLIFLKPSFGLRSTPNLLLVK